MLLIVEAVSFWKLFRSKGDQGDGHLVTALVQVGLIAPMNTAALESSSIDRLIAGPPTDTSSASAAITVGPGAR
jgi:hypothetical protein